METHTIRISLSYAALVCLTLCALGPVVFAQALPQTSVIERLQEGGAALGTFTRSPRPELDYIVIDAQYGALDLSAIRASIAGLNEDQTAVVRTPLAAREAPEAVIRQLLAAGAHGLMFPDVETRAQAQAAIHAMAAEAAGLWPLDSAGQLIAMVQIESPRGIANLEQILEVAGIGVLFLGPTDIASAIGAEGPDATEVEAMVQDVLAVCLARDIACGYPIVADSPRDAEAQSEARLAQGFKVLAVMVRAP